ncbi:MAG: LLM class flavin-dependent oxidoreductase [Euzebyaceae bacterium]|jgi:alkanesulfonate monooxygenase SsuD/methylene tetrahydromethanopterin reductase-like flavin-dependent oxidoreductase (luciferase family)|nr:LLM class flavin-dependent oxidoreductase [Euzebyaceae bacterium]
MSEQLRIGVVVVQNLPWPAWRERVLEVEELGYDAVYVWDHLVHRTQAPTDPLFDGLTALAAAATFTERIRLGTMVAVPIFRHPAVLANQAMTLDRISGGRLDLGIGAGGALLDHDALGIEPWSKPEQVERFTEAVELVDAVLRGGSSYSGVHYSGAGITVAPGPVQQPRPPLTIAAHGPRTLRVAARHADVWNSATTRDLPRDEVLALAAERGRLLDRNAEEAGREPASIRRSVLIGSADWPALSSVGAFCDAVSRYRDVGVSEFVLLHPGHPAERLVGHGATDPDIVRRIADVLPRLRDGAR